MVIIYYQACSIVHSIQIILLLPKNYNIYNRLGMRTDRSPEIDHALPFIQFLINLRIIAIEWTSKLENVTKKGYLEDDELSWSCS